MWFIKVITKYKNPLMISDDANASSHVPCHRIDVHMPLINMSISWEKSEAKKRHRFSPKLPLMEAENKRAGRTASCVRH